MAGCGEAEEGRGNFCAVFEGNEDLFRYAVSELVPVDVLVGRFVWRCADSYCRLVWAELCMTIVAIVQRFDFDLQGAGPKNVVCVSDQFIMGVEDSSGLEVRVSRAES